MANLRDIIAGKAASGRQKDLVDLPSLESLRAEYESADRGLYLHRGHLEGILFDCHVYICNDHRR